ncbi:MAG: Bug family tripartite tricarboxylate transporter substrate binding protein [Burkholderiales bacterium]
MNHSPFNIHHFALMLLCAALATAWSPAQAQQYPTKPIRLIIPIAAGGGPDTIGRAVGQKLTDNLRQTVVVDNRAGASGAIAVELASRAAPDGYTILLISASQVIRPLLFKVPYDLFRDFVPITQLSAQSYVLMASLTVPVKTVSELVKHARATPGKLNYASVGQGSQIHLMTELFRTMAKFEAVHVPYKGIGPAYPDLIAGNIQFMFGSIITSQGHIRANRLQALAVSGPRRIKALPELPTVSEAGVPGFAVTQWYALLAPAGTPRETVEFLNKEANRALQQPEVAGRIAAEGSEAVGVTPQQLAAHMKAEHAKWLKVIKDTGIKGEE